MTAVVLTSPSAESVYLLNGGGNDKVECFLFADAELHNGDCVAITTLLIGPEWHVKDIYYAS